MPKQVIDILNMTMNFDPRSRGTVDGILEHEFFTECRRKELEYVREPIEM
jgi:serine/threonine protein kinase